MWYIPKPELQPHVVRWALACLSQAPRRRRLVDCTRVKGEVCVHISTDLWVISVPLLDQMTCYVLYSWGSLPDHHTINSEHEMYKVPSMPEERDDVFGILLLLFLWGGALLWVRVSVLIIVKSNPVVCTNSQKSCKPLVLPPLRLLLLLIPYPGYVYPLAICPTLTDAILK